MRPVVSMRGPFEDIVQAYRSWEPKGTRIPLSELPATFERLIPNGFPVEVMDDTPVPWRCGLSSLLDHETDGFFHALAGGYASARTDLFERWRTLDSRFFEGQAGRENSGPPSDALGDLPTLGLPISGARLASGGYKRRVLQPYLIAFADLLETYFRHLRRTHNQGYWLGFRPLQNGRLAPLPITAQAHQSDLFVLPRSALQAALELDAASLDHLRLAPDRDFADPASWRFIAAADLPGRLPDQPAAEASQPEEQKPRRGRPRSSGYQRADAPYVDMVKATLAANPHLSKSEAIRRVLDKHDAEVEGASYDAKRRRLLDRLQD